jgi:HK97 family phage major capsid protein
MATALMVVSLEKELANKQAEAAALLEKTCATAEKENRETTDEERAAVVKLLNEGKTIKAKIERAKGDQAISAEIESLFNKQTAGATTSKIVKPTLAQTMTLGNQFIAHEHYAFFKSGQHRVGGTWTSPTFELTDHLAGYGKFLATTLTEDPASGGKLIVPQYLPGILPTMFRRLVVADLLASGTTTSNAIVYMRETAFTNAATPVAEGAAKPESALTFDQVMEAVAKLAHWLPVTDEMLEDEPTIASYIDARLRLGVQLTEEDQLLNGNGTPPNLRGLLNRTGLATAIARVDPATNADVIYQQIAAIANTAFIYPDGIVMNPTNWSTTILSKDSTGRYLGGGPFVPPSAATLWGLPVAPTPAIVAGTALVGAYGSAAQVFRRSGINVAASNSHQDFFIKNLTAIRAEERLALAVYRPGAFGKCTGLN